MTGKDDRGGFRAHVPPDSLYDVTPKFLGELEAWLTQNQFVKKNDPAAGGYDTVQDEGIALTKRKILDFVGGGVTATDDSTGFRTLVTIPTVGTPNLNGVIHGLAPDAWWKLDESSGIIAHDSSGNGWDASLQTGGYVAPTWAQATGPPGTQTAKFVAGTSTGAPGSQVRNGSFPACTTDFSAAIWVKVPVLGTRQLIGQFDPLTTHHAGWSIEMDGVGQIILLIGNTSTGPSTIVADVTYAVNTWYLVGITRISGVFRMYVNGALQSNTSSAAYTSHNGIWLGTDPNGGLRFESIDVFLSYGMAWGSRGLSGAEMLSIYNGAFPFAANTVLINDGSGGFTAGLVTESLISLSDVTTDNVTSTKHGLAPKSPADAKQFLNGAATPAFAQVKDSDLSLSNVTTNDVTTSQHGFAPKLPNDATKYLDGTGAYSTPGGGGGGTFSPSGWVDVSATQTWTYASADSPTYTFTISGDQTAIFTPGTRLQLTQTTVKYFIVTAVSVAAGVTTVTIYGGVNYTLANAAISVNSYSHMKGPASFPLDPSGWTVKVTDTSDRAQASPVSGTVYNLGSLTITFPIGAWHVDFQVLLDFNRAAGGPSFGRSALSTSASSISDAELEAGSWAVDSGTPRSISQTNRHKILVFTTKTQYFLVATMNTTGLSIDFRGDLSTTVMRAICAYL